MSKTKTGSAALPPWAMMESREGFAVTRSTLTECRFKPMRVMTAGGEAIPGMVQTPFDYAFEYAENIKAGNWLANVGQRCLSLDHKLTPIWTFGYKPRKTWTMVIPREFMNLFFSDGSAEFVDKWVEMALDANDLEQTLSERTALRKCMEKALGRGYAGMMAMSIRAWNAQRAAGEKGEGLIKSPNVMPQMDRSGNHVGYVRHTTAGQRVVVPL